MARGAGPAADHDPGSAMSVDKSHLPGHRPSRAEGDSNLTMKPSGNQASNSIVVPGVPTPDDAMDVDND